MRNRLALLLDSILSVYYLNCFSLASFGMEVLSLNLFCNETLKTFKLELQHGTNPVKLICHFKFSNYNLAFGTLPDSINPTEQTILCWALILTMQYLS